MRTVFPILLIAAAIFLLIADVAPSQPSEHPAPEQMTLAAYIDSETKPDGKVAEKSTNTPPPQPPPPTPKIQEIVVPPPSDTASIETEIFRLTNLEREKADLNALSTDSALATIARAHSGDMLERDYFSHDNPEGCSSSCRTTNAGYRWQMIGENIFMLGGWNLTPTETAVLIVNGWLASPGHRENLLKAGYTESGVGIVREGDTLYATALYAAPR